MMAKQSIIAAIEEVFGEYILNMSRENLKIAALRGKIKLENVQLDGDLIGSHVMGALGFSSGEFGILCCYAKSINIIVPWKNLERETTRFEVKGVHLVCVPLTPSTATATDSVSSQSPDNLYGSGTRLDPRCSLRTRAKRLLLSRLERNFWNGQIPGEGPPMKRIQRAVKDIEREFRKSQSNRSRRRPSPSSSFFPSTSRDASAQEEAEIEATFDDILLGLDDSRGQISVEETSNKDGCGNVTGDSSAATNTSFSTDELPELPRDWKAKLRDKILRNMTASIQEVHIRCEVPSERAPGSERESPKDHDPMCKPSNTNNKKGAAPTASDPSTSSPYVRTASFVLGFTLESFVVRTANEQWEVGRHDKGAAMSSHQGHLGPNGYVVKNNKIGFFNNLSVYWDNNPVLLLAETDLLRGNYRKLSPEKLQSRIAAAMDAMFHSQEPGTAVRHLLFQPLMSDCDFNKPHEYICRNLNVEVRVRHSDRTHPGPISCSADVMPFQFEFNIRPHQWFQYYRLKSAIKAQQRFDTMLRQRPSVSPMVDARAWWRYAIGCVTSRPNSRPWDDVKVIVQSRPRYMELVAKKNRKSSDGQGYHAGLSDKESQELLALEDLLPMEALDAFHLLSLRRVYEAQKESLPGDVSLDGTAASLGSEEITKPQARPRSRANPFRLRGGKRRNYSELEGSQPVTLIQSSFDKRLDESIVDNDVVNQSATSVTLLEAMTLRLGKKVWYVYWKFHDVNAHVILLGPSGDRPLAHAQLRGNGSIRSFGKGKRDFFVDVSKFDVYHGEKLALFLRARDIDVISEDDNATDVSDLEDDSLGTLNSSDKVGDPHPGPNLSMASEFLALPPDGIVGRLVAGKDAGRLKLSVSAHPATLVWTTGFIDSFAEFLNLQPPDSTEDLAHHIRNAATPLARKAQLALLSPVAIGLRFNIAAPKIWTPIASDSCPGSLFLDAGLIKIAGEKEEGQTDIDWDFLTKDIQMNFVQGRGMPISPDELQLQWLSHTLRSGTSIIQPFQVSVKAMNRTIQPANDSLQQRVTVGAARCVDVTVSPLSLNLVDAEALARAFGKWYTMGIKRVRHRVIASEGPNQEQGLKLKHVGLSPVEPSPVVDTYAPSQLDVKLERVEIALEGHSKMTSTLTDDRSLASLDSYHEVAPPTRTYLLEVHEIRIRRSRKDHISSTSLLVMDAAISRLRDGSLYTPLTGTNREFNDSQYRIMVRAPESLTGQSSNSSSLLSGSTTVNSSSSADISDPSAILRGSLVHDRRSHLDEVEVDIDSVILRVTPTTLKDCAKAFRRVIELAQLMTREMERKVHEEGRRARRSEQRISEVDTGHISQGQTTDSDDRPSSPVISEAQTDFTGVPQPLEKAADSSILFKVTLRESTLLAGRPTSAIERSPFYRDKAITFAVVQVLSNALIMFQSIENADASGTKTLHISLDNISSIVNTAFDRVPPSMVTPMIGPTGAEFRIVYTTENFGCVVSQDLSIDLEPCKVTMTPNDLSIFLNISLKMFEKLRAFGVQSPAEKSRGPRRMRPLASIVRYQKRGTGIATTVRIEVQAFSFVLLRAYKSFVGAPEFLDFNVNLLKGKFTGCVSALSGECTASFAIRFFNREVREWEYAVEPFLFVLSLDQMPNELILNLTSESAINLNMTGIFLRDFEDVKFDFIRTNKVPGHVDTSREGSILSPSALSTVGLRRATESRRIRVHNRTGFDIHVVPDLTPFDSNSGLVPNGGTEFIDDGSTSGNDEPLSLTLRLAQSAVESVGNREPIYDLPIVSAISGGTRMFLLRPVATYESLRPGKASLLRLFDGRASPETILTEATNLEAAYQNAEPVVEWAMNNQRLRSNVADVFSVDKGRDLLSSNLWSPEDEINDDADEWSKTIDDDGPEVAAGHQRSSPSRSKTTITLNRHRSNWVKPYLTNDSPEWTDMTCTLHMARERVMLPDPNWIWLSDWTVDLSGKLGDATDADGWEYQTDFETFTRKRRDYQRGDSCRRRRWTRIRIVKPPMLEDPLRQLKIVWETSKQEDSNYDIVVRSNVRVVNTTASPLSFFVFSPSWEDDVFVGSALPGEDLCVPVHLAGAVYMRIAKPVANAGQTPVSARACVKTDRFVILPTSHSSSKYIRTTMNLSDVSGTTLHYLVEIKSTHGVVDVTVEPVLRVVNLLPCQLECQVGETLMAGDSRAADGRPIIGRPKRIAQGESTMILSGKEGSCTAINPWRKPHISLRVPGYQWSPWQRIINRKNALDSWRPSESEEDYQFVDTDFTDEHKTVVRFKRAGPGGDPLTLILSVECGHCPTLRVYSQYWILDKTGFGCRFSEAFTDLFGSTPDSETSRRSYLPSAEEKSFKGDLSLHGHQWSIGMSGMTLYFSRRKKLTLAIESGVRGGRSSKNVKSKWVSPLDISYVVPKTVFTVNELNGPRRFELAICVTVCPGVFARTKLITLLPRFQIVNLLHRELVIAQDGCLHSETLIPSQSAVPFHWEKGAANPKVRIGVPSSQEKSHRQFESCFTNGRFRIDRVGITSIRLPTDKRSKIPLVVQAEVRLAAKEQSSAIVVVIWAANPNSNPLYVLRNRTPYTIICRQPLQGEDENPQNPEDSFFALPVCAGDNNSSRNFECNASDLGPLLKSLIGIDAVEEFIWILKSNDVACFGFDDPEKPHVLEWTCIGRGSKSFSHKHKKAYLEVDAMGSTSVLHISGNTLVRCHIAAEHSTKVIEFVEVETDSIPRESSVARLHIIGRRKQESNIQDTMNSDEEEEDEDDDPGLSIRINTSAVHVSIVDNVDPKSYGREILLASLEGIFMSFSQTREGYHEFEMRLMSFQVDNHVHKSIHPVLVFCPRLDESEPHFHMSAVRRLQPHSRTYVFRYAAIRLLEVDIFLDRKTAECIAKFIEPLTTAKDDAKDHSGPDWVSEVTVSMGRKFAKPDRDAPREIEKMIHTANSGRIYFEQLHLHPVRLGLTFTQEWIEWNGAETMMIFQFIRGMASIASAPLVFTSFVVGHVFEAPQELSRVIVTHYSSQLTKQIFGILGSLAILGAPADFISNVGTGVRDFFYEPIQGAVHGPRQFIEGLEAGTQSLARGLFVGVVRGTANVTEVVNSNLAGLTADDEFIDERKAHQRMLTDAMSRGSANRTFQDSLSLAGASVARGLKAGAVGIIEQPSFYASKHGPVGFIKGVGKAIVGAVVKPVVGLGDAAVLVMNHMSDATSKTQVLPKIPKRLRRALPCRSTKLPNCVRLDPYDERAAKAQKIVTGGESIGDVYLGHINTPSHLIIASEQCLWAIDKRSRDPWCVSWEEISHFGLLESGVPVVVFSQTGLKTYIFHVEGPEEAMKLHTLLSMQKHKMGNSSELNSTILTTEPESLSRHHIPGVKAPQVNHVFGSCNLSRKLLGAAAKDEIDLVEECFSRVRIMGSDSSTFFKTLDQEAWSLVASWGQVFSGLSSRRCIVAGVINGTGNPIQMKSTKLVEGGSPCYSIPTKEFDQEQGILNPGGVIIFFGWGVVPNLLQAGKVFMHIETSGFIGDLSDHKSRETYAEAMPGYQIGFLEKSYDESGWWAKYWLLVREKR